MDSIIIPIYLDYLVGYFTFVQVIWSHATNTQAELASAMAGSVMMIEADVSLGMQILFVISTFASEINK
jgi:hypothetical protein